jgi:hypothetical protein
MRPDSEFDNSPPSTVEVKRAWRYISTPSCALIAYVGTASSPYLYTVEEDARKLASRNWLAAAQDRGRWRHLLEKAKAHPGL